MKQEGIALFEVAQAALGALVHVSQLHEAEINAKNGKLRMGCETPHLKRPSGLCYTAASCTGV